MSKSPMPKSMKKLCSLFLSLMLATLVLSACGGGDGGDVDTVDPAVDDAGIITDTDVVTP